MPPHILLSTDVMAAVLRGDGRRLCPHDQVTTWDPGDGRSCWRCGRTGVLQALRTYGIPPHLWGQAELEIADRLTITPIQATVGTAA